MLKIQQKYIEFIEKTESALKNTKLDINLEPLKNKIENQELIVPIVGGFSAGKSSLINSFLGNNYLPTGITPETALATELRYSNSNYYEAYKKDGSFDKYNIEEINLIKQNANNYKFLKLYLSNQKLKDIEPLILVDMPGFDSPLELHNQAILNYLNKGVYFIILTSIIDGTISKSMTREINNILEFGKDFTFCLSKTNLRTQSDILEVKSNIEEQIELEFDLEKDIILLDKNGGENLNKILNSINEEELFKSIFANELKNRYFDIDSTLNVTISTLNNNKEESLNAINELKESISKIESKKIEMINEAKDKYSKVGVNSIITAIIKEIINNENTLIRLALSSQQAFSTELNNIIKTKLIREIKTRVKNISDDIVDSFSVELNTLRLDNFQIDKNYIEQIANDTKDILNKTQSGLETLAKTTNKSGTIYKAITTILGITTTILNPLIEVVLIFLPDIISFFTSNNKEEKAKIEIKNRLHSQIIPELKIKLEDELNTIFEEQVNELITTISKEFETKLKQKEEEINKALMQKEQNINEIQQQIEILQNKKISLQNIANKYIFK